MSKSQQIRLEEGPPWIRGLATVVCSLIGALGVFQAMSGFKLGWVLFGLGQLLVFLTARSFPLPVIGKKRFYLGALMIAVVLTVVNFGAIYFLSL